MSPTFVGSPSGESSLSSSISSIAFHHSPTDSSSQPASPLRSPPSSVDGGDLTIEPAVKALASSTEVARTVSTLLSLSHELVSRVSGNQIAQGEDAAPGREDLTQGTEDMVAVATLISQTLEATKQLAQLQEETSERLLNLESTMVNVRGDVGSVQYRANRLLYRAREHVRKEREAMRGEERLAIAVQNTLSEDVCQLNVDLASMNERNTTILDALRGLEAELEELKANDARRSVLPAAFQELRDTLRDDYGRRVLELLTSGAQIASRIFGRMTHVLKTVIHGCQWASTRCAGIITLPAGLIWGLVWFILFLLIFGYCTRSSIEDRPVWQLARA
ncbi:hypothetical protein LXA43DRAFT_1090463 [Ganoderma leucocontextum]|nr:hypothetical protein LXA43DRAFT_1090463 [Ganoderma leucocontextum]